MYSFMQDYVTASRHDLLISIQFANLLTCQRVINPAGMEASPPANNPAGKLTHKHDRRLA
jgi:hypothetical protein